MKVLSLSSAALGFTLRIVSSIAEITDFTGNFLYFSFGEKCICGLSGLVFSVLSLLDALDAALHAYFKKNTYAIRVHIGSKW